MTQGNYESNRNILPNTYIPVILKKVNGNILGRLPRSSLVELVNLWPKLVNTQPHIVDRVSKYRQRHEVKVMQNEIKGLRALQKKIPKKKIVDKILYEYWEKGLNLLQISQVDCQLLVDRPHLFHWVLTKVRDTEGAEMAVLIDPQQLMEQLAKELSLLYMVYTYACRHPRLPIVVIRIQLFDLNASGIKRISSRPHVTSQKPFFLAIPSNSSKLIHSFGNDISCNIIMQAVQRCLLQIQRNLVKFETLSTQKPVRSLETMHVLNGSSRFGNSMGIWTPYADGTADILPLTPAEKHRELNEEPDLDGENNESDRQLRRLKQVANLRFKGTVDGRYKSLEFFDIGVKDNNNGKVTGSFDTNSMSHILKDNEGTQIKNVETQEESTQIRSEFSSIAPLQYAQFRVSESSSTQASSAKGPPEKNTFSITMKLTGSDIFAGLHELSVLTTDKDRMIIDPSKIPGWLTGVEGNIGTVYNKKFIRGT